MFSCASLTPPNGGPDDKTGPEVLISTPVLNATNISTDTRIGFTFSEWISTKSVRYVSIFPPVAFKSKLYNNKLEIYPLTKLQDSTTYHVLLTSSLLDLHGNPISPINLIFSTGPELDSGSLRGCVINSSEKAPQYRVALFTQKDLTDSGVTGTPSYLLQTDTMGRFDFKHLKINTYHAFAYTDGNNDAHLQSGSEAIFTTEDSLILIGKDTPPVTFFPALFDTSFPGITNLKASNNKVISAKWSKSYDSLVFNPPVMTIERIDTMEQRNSKYTPLNNSQTFALCTNSPLNIAPYQVVYSITRIFDNQIFSDTVLFNGTNTIDSICPKLQIKPDTSTAIDLKTPLSLIWSKPVRITQSLYLTDLAGNSIATLISEGYSDTSIIIPVSRLQPGTIYKMSFSKNLASDLYGNSIFSSDSTDTADTLWVKTIEPGNMATSLQGSAACLKHSDSRVWIYMPLGSPQEKHYANDSAGFFRFDSISAGKGQIGYFIDKNHNRIPDKGRIYPWHSPEPFLMSADTVEARARWDIEGITVPLCDPCQLLSTEKTTTDTLNSQNHK